MTEKSQEGTLRCYESRKEKEQKYSRKNHKVSVRSIWDGRLGGYRTGCTAIRKIESNEIEEKNATENVAFLDDKERETKAGSEEAYSQLSEADRRAMEYGYQMQQKDAEKKVRQKKRRKIAKRAGVTAAALVAVFGVSMTSDANRRYVLEAWNGVIERVGIRTEMNYLEDQPVYEGDTSRIGTLFLYRRRKLDKFHHEKK